MSANKEETLSQFCDVTGADEARSRFFLESSNWQLEVALSSFYENGGNADDSLQNPGGNVAPIPVLSDSDMESPPLSPAKPQKKDKKAKQSSNQRFATLSSLQQDSSSDEEEVTKPPRSVKDTSLLIKNVFCDNATCSKRVAKEKKSDPKCDCKELVEKDKQIEGLMSQVESQKKEIAELKAKIEQGQAFYAGGSDRSGQQIIGPGKSKMDIVSQMFKSVKQRTELLDDNQSSSTSRGGGGGGLFGGVGYRLGQTPDDHETVSTGNTGAQGGARSVHLRLYRGGFTLDDGPLLPYSEPENMDFLNCIRRGEIPPSLSANGAEVRVALEDKRHEECPAATSRRAPVFAGKGHVLGSPTPAAVGATGPSDRAVNERQAQEKALTDDSQPTTTIQFRLADGSRLSGRFNHTHTVGQLRQYITTAVPAYQLQNFVLMTTFPSVELNDNEVTVEQAKLLNSVVVQRLK